MSAAGGNAEAPSATGINENSEKVSAYKKASKMVMAGMVKRGQGQKRILDLARDARVEQSGPLSWVLDKVYHNKVLFFVFLAHLFGTLIVWHHFFYIKFKAQEAGVPTHYPEGFPNAAFRGEPMNRYWWKRLTPPLEFGAMHAILFQMALLPLTMCRYSLMALSTTSVRKYIPLNLAQKAHNHLGYVMCGFVFASTILFFIFFGILCDDFNQGNEPSDQFCKNFTTEIMLTGYGIIGILIIVAVTSFLRYRIKYEVFYVIHHLVFVMFALAIAHTVDDKQRETPKERSQVFKWVLGSLSIYIADRAFLIMSMKKARLVGAVVTGDDEHHVHRLSVMSKIKDISKSLVLRLKKPHGFNYHAGHYCFIQVPEIGYSWHPYSIMSDPSQGSITLFIEVMKEGQWTEKLHRLVANAKHKDELGKLDFRIVGPYGASLNPDVNANAGASPNHIVGIGAGTGVVPIISLMRQSCNHYLQLHPREFFRLQDQDNKRASDALWSTVAPDSDAPNDEANLSNFNIGKLASQMNRASTMNMQKTKYTPSNRYGSMYASSPSNKVTPVSGPTENTDEEMERAAAMLLQASARVYLLKKFGKKSATFKDLMGRVRTAFLERLHRIVILFFALLELIVFGLGVSWYVTEADTSELGFQDPIRILSWINLTVYIGSLYITEGFPATRFRGIFSMFVGVGNIAAFAVWEDWGSWEALSDYQVFLFGFFALFRFARNWTAALETVSMRTLAMTSAMTSNRLIGLDSFEFVWITRHAGQVANMWGELDAYYKAVRKVWGPAVNEILKIRVYCTDKRAEMVEQLQHVTAKTTLGRNTDALQIVRPDIQGIFTGHLQKRIREDTMVSRGLPQRTMVAFCGGSGLSRVVQNAVFDASVMAEATGYDHIGFTFTEESQGEVPASVRKKLAIAQLASTARRLSRRASSTVKKMMAEAIVPIANVVAPPPPTVAAGTAGNTEAVAVVGDDMTGLVGDEEDGKKED